VAAPNQPAWARPGILVKPPRNHAINDCGPITCGALHEPLSASGQVLPDLQGAQLQAFKIDHIDVGALTRGKMATIGKAK
jgi:hypothetical protein